MPSCQRVRVSRGQTAILDDPAAVNEDLVGAPGTAENETTGRVALGSCVGEVIEAKHGDISTHAGSYGADVVPAEHCGTTSSCESQRLASSHRVDAVTAPGHEHCLLDLAQ